MTSRALPTLDADLFGRIEPTLKKTRVDYAIGGAVARVLTV